MNPYKKKVFSRAVCEAFMQNSPPPDLRTTLNTLAAGNYNIPDAHLSVLLLQMSLQEQTETCEDMTKAELAGRQQARRQIATEVLGLNRNLNERDRFFISSIIGPLRKAVWKIS